jgi:hypothetical protein
MKVAVIGSRTFNDYESVKDKLDSISDITLIVSGGAMGADTLGERYARENGISTVIFKPDWSKGRGAGFLRNTDIINEADIVVAFWDGKSRGTLDSIKKAEKQGKKVLICPKHTLEK